MSPNYKVILAETVAAVRFVILWDCWKVDLG